MNFIKRFLAFWYDFIVGDAWEVAAGVVAVLGIGAGLHPHGHLGPPLQEIGRAHV